MYDSMFSLSNPPLAENKELQTLTFFLKRSTDQLYA